VITGHISFPHGKMIAFCYCSHVLTIFEHPCFTHNSCTICKTSGSYESSVISMPQIHWKMDKH